jgi:hypothetical protein
VGPGVNRDLIHPYSGMPPPAATPSLSYLIYPILNVLFNIVLAALHLSSTLLITCHAKLLLLIHFLLLSSIYAH